MTTPAPNPPASDRSARITGFHHAAIHASDFDATVAFWTQTFGFVLTISWAINDDGHGAIMLDVGDGNYLEVFEHPDTPKPASDAPQGIVHIALRCVGIVELIDRVRAAGLTITMEPTQIPIANTLPGKPATVPVHIAFFTGPDGEVVELFENTLT